LTQNGNGSARLLGAFSPREKEDFIHRDSMTRSYMVWAHALGYALLMLSTVLFDLDETLLDRTGIVTLLSLPALICGHKCRSGAKSATPDIASHP
jgi:hypothetical protein